VFFKVWHGYLVIIKPVLKNWEQSVVMGLAAMLAKKLVNYNPAVAGIVGSFKMRR